MHVRGPDRRFGGNHFGVVVVVGSSTERTRQHSARQHVGSADVAHDLVGRLDASIAGERILRGHRFEADRARRRHGGAARRRRAEEVNGKKSASTCAKNLNYPRHVYAYGAVLEDVRASRRSR